MRYFKYILGIVAVVSSLSACKKDLLDRPPQASYVDDPTKFWRSEDDVRLYGNGFYTNYFNGFNTGFTVDYAPVRGYTFSDDLTGKNAQTSFEASVPSSRGTTSEAGEWLTQYAGPSWNFSWVRKSNIFLDRLDNVAKPKMSDEAYKHWTAVAKFFRGFEYSRLVSVFGAVPYFDRVVAETELSVLYKDRDARGVVMDKVYDDFKYALSNMRVNDGNQNLNKYIAAGFISRLMLFEGTYQYYHGIDNARAKKYLEFAVEAADIVMTSGKYNFTKDFKSVFSSESLAGHPEVLLYRIYDAGLGVTHSIGSYSNGTEVNGVDANLVLVKSFLATDGQPYKASTVPNASSFAIADLVKTRDPRFEATFIDKALNSSATLLYNYKYASREAITYIGKTYPAAWASNTNTSDAPVLRLGEIVLNWIEAKAVLAEGFGGAPITQPDLDKSINALRNRPLDAEATAKGLVKTAPLLIGAIPVDVDKDPTVPDLMWEIRRERRMELFAENARLLDLKRWKKLHYMNFSTNSDYFLGPWVNLQTELPSILTTANATAANVKVRKLDGTTVTYNGTNAANMVGFWVVTNATNRNAFTDRSYLAPVGQNQIIQYQERGFTLTQSPLW